MKTLILAAALVAAVPAFADDERNGAPGSLGYDNPDTWNGQPRDGDNRTEFLTGPNGQTTTCTSVTYGTTTFTTCN